MRCVVSCSAVSFLKAVYSRAVSGSFCNSVSDDTATTLVLLAGTCGFSVALTALLVAGIFLTQTGVPLLRNLSSTAPSSLTSPTRRL